MRTISTVIAGMAAPRHINPAAAYHHVRARSRTHLPEGFTPQRLRELVRSEAKYLGVRKPLKSDIQDLISQVIHEDWTTGPEYRATKNELKVLFDVDHTKSVNNTLSKLVNLGWIVLTTSSINDGTRCIIDMRPMIEKYVEYDRHQRHRIQAALDKERPQALDRLYQLRSSIHNLLAALERPLTSTIFAAPTNPRDMTIEALHKENHRLSSIEVSLWEELAQHHPTPPSTLPPQIPSEPDLNKPSGTPPTTPLDPRKSTSAPTEINFPPYCLPSESVNEPASSKQNTATTTNLKPARVKTCTSAAELEFQYVAQILPSQYFGLFAEDPSWNCIEDIARALCETVEISVSRWDQGNRILGTANMSLLILLAYSKSQEPAGSPHRVHSPYPWIKGCLQKAADNQFLNLPKSIEAQAKRISRRNTDQNRDVTHRRTLH